MQGPFHIIKHAKMWIFIGVCIMAVSVFMFLRHQQYSIQFTGGIEIVVDQPSLDTNVATAVQEKLTTAGLVAQNISVGKKDGFGSLLVQIALADDTQVQSVTSLIKETLIAQKVITSADEILEQSIIGPSIGEYMKKSALYAVIRGLIGIGIYILFSFSGLREIVSPLRLGIITVFTMLFDIMFPAGMYGLWIAINPAVNIDAVFVIAILTVMGYSINDTIIIFDRVRDNFSTHAEKYQSGKLSVGDLFETSLRQTMRRSLGTSFTTFIVIASMWVFGTGALKLFAFTLGMGVIAGSFSSIFFAAPLAYLIAKKHLKEAK